MQTGSISQSQIARFGRMDAPFHLLVTCHLPLIDELDSRLSVEELVKLAHDLPFDRAAFRCVYTKPHPGDASAAFRYWLAKQVLRRTDLAVYVAAAAQHAVSKILLEVEQLKLQEKARIATCKQLIDFAVVSDTPLLQCAMTGKATDTPGSVLPAEEEAADDEE